MNPYLLDFDFGGTLRFVDGSRSFPKNFFWNPAGKRDGVRPCSGRCLKNALPLRLKYIIFTYIYPLFRLKWPCALNVFKFFFVVLNHLASPIFRNHTTPDPPQVGTLFKYGYAILRKGCQCYHFLKRFVLLLAG